MDIVAKSVRVLYELDLKKSVGRLQVNYFHCLAISVHLDQLADLVSLKQIGRVHNVPPLVPFHQILLPQLLL